MAAVAVVGQGEAWVMRLQTRPGLMRQGRTALKAGAATALRVLVLLLSKFARDRWARAQTTALGKDAVQVRG